MNCLEVASLLETFLNFIHCLKPPKKLFLKEHHGLYQRSRPSSLKGPVLEIEIDQQQLRVEKVLDYPESNAITLEQVTPVHSLAKASDGFPAPYSKTDRNGQKCHFKVKIPSGVKQGHCGKKKKKSEEEQEKVQALSIFGEKDLQGMM